MRICVDSSVLVVLLLQHDERHDAVRTDLARRVGLGEKIVVTAHSLVEAYSTLTRMPPRFRLSPDVALEGVERFAQGREVLALAPHEYLELLRTAPSRGISGGRIYDALIARTAVQSATDAILTFNDRHFAGLEPSLQVLVPGQ